MDRVYPVEEESLLQAVNFEFDLSFTQSAQANLSPSSERRRDKDHGWIGLGDDYFNQPPELAVAEVPYDQQGRGEAFPHVSTCGLLENYQPDPCLLYTSPSPRDKRQSRMPSSA